MIKTNIRLTKAEDVHALPDIERSAGESFRGLPELAWIADDEDMSAETHLQYVMQGTSWVAEADDQIIGFLCAQSAGRDLHIEEFAVRLEWQGQGIGRQLMNTAIEHARRNRFRSATLTTFRKVPWNEPFYRSLGFEIIEAEKLEPRLEKILQAEIQRGLSGDLRCAMRLWISPQNEKDS